jgi:hypothetical protein
MYYHAYDGSVSRILSAVSSDGLSWRREAGVRIDQGPPGSPDQLGASHFYVLQFPDQSLLMHYAGGRRFVFGDSILSARSTDGLTWVKEEGTRLELGPPGSPDDTILLQPSVVELPDGDFRMYYAGFDGTMRILSAVARPSLIYVSIDVNPDRFPNRINLRSRRAVRVAVLSTPTFAADRIVVDTLRFAGASPVRSALRDVNRDGLVDLVVRFRARELRLTPDSTAATLTGETSSGATITGTDSVEVVDGARGRVGQ